MKQYYESEVLFQLMERDGLNIPSSVPPYEAEIKAYLINQVKQAYPKLTDYEAEWLLYNYTKHLPAEFPISSVSDVTEATFENVVPFAYQSAILKGNTKYRDIDTGDILDTFDETKNLELVSVKMPVLTTTNEDGTKTNILTVNEPVELRGDDEVQDTLSLITGELTQRIGSFNDWDNADVVRVSNYGLVSRFDLKIAVKPKGKIKTNLFPQGSIGTSDLECVAVHGSSQTIQTQVLTSKLSSNTADGFKEWAKNNNYTVQYQLAESTVKTVDLTNVNEKGETTYFMPLEGTMSVQSSGEIIQPTFDMTVPIEATTQNLASFIDMEMEE